jgi:hypothetical protein
LKTPASRAQQPFEIEENVIFRMINKYNYNQPLFAIEKGVGFAVELEILARTPVLKLRAQGAHEQTRGGLEYSGPGLQS